MSSSPPLNRRKDRANPRPAITMLIAPPSLPSPPLFRSLNPCVSAATPHSEQGILTSPFLLDYSPREPESEDCPTLPQPKSPEPAPQRFPAVLQISRPIVLIALLVGLY